MKRIHHYIVLLITLLSGVSLSSCRDSIISDDPSLHLSFSCDTLSFDTLFTGIGSATGRIMVRNPHSNALLIRRAWVEKGTAFHVNVDGETDLSRMTDMELRGGDSLYIFVRAFINEQNSDTPVRIEDAIHLEVNDHVETVHLEAYGWDANLIRTAAGRTQVDHDTVFTAGRPYLIYDTLLLAGNVTIEAGTRIYVHQSASIYCYGNLDIQGTIANPVTIMGDRLDKLFEHVPYSYSAGQWGGLYLVDDGRGEAHQHTLQGVQITGGNIGLYCISERKTDLPKLRLIDSRIHNHALYGLVLIQVDAEVCNTEISNAASYCVYLSGGNHRFIHTTIADYFDYTNMRYLQSASRDTVAAVYIDDLSKQGPRTVSSFINSVIMGPNRNNVMLATPLPQYYAGEFIGCYLKTDSMTSASAHDNVYWHAEDTAKVFQNDVFLYGEWQYYDFRLDSLSPARGIALPDVAASFPTDLYNNSRLADGAPDAGCYEYLSNQ